MEKLALGLADLPVSRINNQLGVCRFDKSSQEMTYENDKREAL